MALHPESPGMSGFVAPEADVTSAPGPRARLRFSDIVALLIIALMLGVLLAVGTAAASALPVQDLAQYWAGAHLVNSNPYSQELVASFEHSHAVTAEGTPMVMRNPPQALLLVLPLRFLSYRIAFGLWDLLSVILVALCARTAYSLVSRNPSISPALLSLLFGPTAALLMLGQIVILVLLGITLFFLLVERRKDWLAGAALFLIIPKPHLLLLFIVAVVLWAVHQRRWLILLSAVTTTTIASAAILLLNPHVFAQYLVFVREFSRETTPYPNLGGLLYTLTGQHFLAYLPTIAAIIWLAVYWTRNRQRWDWNIHGMTVLMVSIASSYYSFAFDQIVMIPALMVAFAAGNRLWFYAGFALTNLGYVLYISGAAGHFGFGPMFLWWTFLALLFTYLLSRRPQITPGIEPVQSG
jgi:hypothetical protein